MSYIVLARKWRPKGFDELVGQNTVSTILKNAISQDRIAHAYLFSGPRGVGKTSTARILSKALNCESGPTVDPCGECNACRAISEGYSVDVMEIDGASNNSVDDIRDLRERVKYAPSSGRYKVYIIDEAHMLSQSAFNALLKTLEEPPPHVIFVLATTAPHKIPITVMSRCQHLTFSRVRSGVMKAHIKRITDEEGIAITGQAIELLLRAADGSMRDALTLLDQLSAFSSDITDSAVRDLLGLSDVEIIISLTDSILGGDRKEILAQIDNAYERGIDLKNLVRDLIRFIRDFLAAQVSGGENLQELSEDERNYIKSKTPAIMVEELAVLLSEMIKAEADVRNAYSPRVALEMALLRASMLGSLRPVGEIIERLEKFGSALAEPVPDVPHPQERKAPEEISGNMKTDSGRESLDADTLQTAWEGVISRIDEEDAILASKLRNAEPRIDKDRLSLVFNGGHAIHAESVEKHFDSLLGWLREKGGSGFENISRIEIVKKKANKRKERSKITPAERKVLEGLGGRIIERRKTNV